MRKRKLKTKALTAGERRLANSAFILTADDQPTAPAWLPPAPTEPVKVTEQFATGQPGIGQGGAQ
jgi:hypothetical protein